MRRIAAAFLVASFLLVCSAASAQRTGGSFGIRSWGYRTTTIIRPSSVVPRPTINRVGSSGTPRFDRHVAWWPNMHSGRHDHHVIVVGSGDRDRPTDEGAKAAFCATLIACLLAYALIKF